MPLTVLLPAYHSQGQLEIHLEQNKYANAKLSVFRQKKIEGILEKNIFKIVMLKEVLGSI